MKKSTNNTLLVIFLIMIVLGGLFVYFNISKQQAVTASCKLIDSGVVSKTFSCPGDSDDRCSVSGSGSCTTQSTQSSVIFRTSSNSYSGGWISLDMNSDGSLDGLSYRTSTTSSTFRYHLNEYGMVVLPITTPEGYKIVKCTGQSTCYSSQFRTGDIAILMEGSDIKFFSGVNYEAVTTSFPVQGYETKEKYSSFLYVCTADLTKGDGTILQKTDFKSNVANSPMPNTNKFDITAGTTVNYGNYNINYESYQCGTCGECAIGDKKCVSDTSYYECTSDGSGCGVKTITNTPVNQVCINDVVQNCNDNNVCTTDTRAAGASTCTYTPIANCCKASTDCNDNNACTTDTCSANRCINSQVANCCTPSCDSNTQYCENQVCKPKKGCKFSNPSCTSPQTCDLLQNVDASTFGKCVCPTTPEYCDSSLVNTEKCSSNSIFVCTKSSTELCYKWQLKQTCGETDICIDK